MRHGAHVADVKREMTARCVRKSERNDVGLVETCMGAATVVVEGVPAPDPDADNAGAPDAARSATACRRADVRSGFGAACAGGAAKGGAPAVGRLNMASMVGRRAAPKGVDKKSAGRSE